MGRFETGFEHNWQVTECTGCHPVEVVEMFTKFSYHSLSVLEFAGDRDTTREPCPDRIIEEQRRNNCLAQLFGAAGSVFQYFQKVYSER